MSDNAASLISRRLCGHSLKLILTIFLHFHITEIRLHFREAWCILSVSSKLSSCHFNHTDLGIDVLLLFEISGNACVQLSPHAFIFSTVLNRSKR